MIFLGLGEAGFSMVRLKTIAKQRELFSSFESLSQSSSDEEVRTYLIMIEQIDTYLDSLN